MKELHTTENVENTNNTTPETVTEPEATEVTEAVENTSELTATEEKAKAKTKNKRAPRVKVDDVDMLFKKDIKRLTLPEAKILVKELSEMNTCLKAQVKFYKENAETAFQKVQEHERAIDCINAQVNARNNAIKIALENLTNMFKFVNGGKL